MLRDDPGENVTLEKKLKRFKIVKFIISRQHWDKIF